MSDAPEEMGNGETPQAPAKKLAMLQWLGTIGFVALIGIPAVTGWLTPDRASSESERRTLATRPAAPNDVDALQSYPERFATYYADHFGFRDTFVQAYKALKYAIGDSPSGDLTLGKDGYLFLGGIGDSYVKFNDPFGDVRNRNLYTEAELALFAKNIVATRDYLASVGVEYLFIVTPNKHTIYFDKLPNGIERTAPQSALDQLVEYLDANTDIGMMDLRDALLDERKTHEVYHRTDTHWNNFGADRAQFEISKRLNQLFPGEFTPARTDMSELRPFTGDLAAMLGVEVAPDDAPFPLFPEACTPERLMDEAGPPRRESYSCDSGKRSAMIFHDSFFIALKPYFIRKFAESKFYSGSFTLKVFEEVIERDGYPDVVIEQWVERKLPRRYWADRAKLGALESAAAPASGRDATSPSSADLVPPIDLSTLRFKDVNTVSAQGSNGPWELEATSADPIIYFPTMSFEPGQTYVLDADITSDVNTRARLYYSTSEVGKFPFSDVMSVATNVPKGRNTIRLEFASPMIGNRLRLDVRQVPGRFTIHSLRVSPIAD